MPSIKDLWPDKWLKPEHLQGKKVAVHLHTVRVEQLYNPRSRKEEARLVISFHGKARRMVLNKTQATSLAQITGTEDYTDWHGHTVVISTGIAPILISPLPDAAPPTIHAATPPAASPAPGSDDDGQDDEPTDPPTVGDWR